jgi:hypothetical protein
MLRKLYSLGEDIMIGADLGGGAALVQAARAALLQGHREARGELAEAEAGLAVADARVRARPAASEVAVLCPCRIRGA